MVEIREEKPTDIPAICRLNEETFGQLAEANIVDSLRSGCDQRLSLVAILEERVVGYIFFSLVILESK